MNSLTKKPIYQISRREFLLRLGGITTGALLLPLFPTNERSGIARAGAEGIDVRTFGANPAARPADNVKAFQRAIDFAAKSEKSLVVYVPAGTYRTDNPIYMRDYVTLQGEGPKSHIRNIADKGLSTNAIMMGDYDGRSFLRGHFFGVEPASKNDTSIVFRNREDAGNFRVGDIIIFQSDEGFRGDKRPEFQEINEVADLGVGKVTLKYPLHDDLGGAYPKVQRSGDPTNKAVRGNTAKVVKGATIRDLAVSSNGSWMSLGGAFECLIENLYLDSAAIVNLNGFARSTMKRIRANYWRRMIHMAYYCHHSLIEDVQANYREGYAKAEGEGINLGEGCHNNTVRNIDISSTDPGGYRALIAVANCKHNEISGVRAKLSTAPDLYIVEMRGDLFKCIGNVIRNCDIEWGGSVEDIIRINPPHSRKPEKIADNKVLDSRFNGAASRFAVALHPGMNNEIDGNAFSSGGYMIHGNSIRNKLTNNVFSASNPKHVVNNPDNTINAN